MSTGQKLQNLGTVYAQAVAQVVCGNVPSVMLANASRSPAAFKIRSPLICMYNGRPLRWTTFQTPERVVPSLATLRAWSSTMAAYFAGTSWVMEPPHSSSGA